MVRFLILGAALTIALSIYAVVDCAMSEPRRIRIFQKQLWLVIVLLLPLIGPLCWILFGKGLITINGGGASSAASSTATPNYGGQRAPDDDTEFLRKLREETPEERLKRLEEELASLDEVTFPASSEPAARGRDADATTDPAPGAGSDDAAEDDPDDSTTDGQTRRND
ncbi:PLDc N-terminal domain-containing protein [Pseudoclavibacter albus]|uniref:PLDc N-terminal domain-containing protein n=1 Tax=Pseudoclavibacter albus TaxID=272241 RepID=UPI00082594C1|nr:PLDc N-terminal domain-containing protein [Pseudoclavibacter alba]